MTSLTLELGGHEPFDLALDARRFVLWRQGSVVRLTLGPADLDRVRRSLALRGVRTVHAEGDVRIPPRLAANRLAQKIRLGLSARSAGHAAGRCCEARTRCSRSAGRRGAGTGPCAKAAGRCVRCYSTRRPRPGRSSCTRPIGRSRAGSKDELARVARCLARRPDRALAHA